MWLRLEFRISSILVQAAACVGLLGAVARSVASQRPDTARSRGIRVPSALLAETAIPIGPQLSLATVVNRTLEHSPTYDSALGRLRVARSAQRVAFGNYLPTISSSGLYARSNQSFTSPGLTTTSTTLRVRTAYTGGVAGSLTLYSGGFRSAVTRETAARTRAAGAGLVLSRYTTQLIATEGYLEVLRSHELVRVGEDAVAVAAKGLSFARTMRLAGTATPADVLQAQFAFTTAQRQLLAAQDTLVAAAAALARLVGADELVDAEPLADLDPTPLPIGDSSLVALAMSDAPAVLEANQLSIAAAATIRAAKAQYAPVISASTLYNWSNNALVLGAPRTGWYVGFGLAWPWFTGYQQQDSVTRARVAARVAAVTASDTRRSSGAEARQLLASLRLAEQNVALGKEEVRVATENLRVISVRYRAGVATILDLLTSQQLLIQGELDLVSARYAYQVARASLSALVGREL